jgi:hypothetical protein
LPESPLINHEGRRLLKERLELTFGGFHAFKLPQPRRSVMLHRLPFALGAVKGHARQRLTTRQVNLLFGLTLPRSSVAEQKKQAAKLYGETRQVLLRRIVAGTLVHADETPIYNAGQTRFCLGVLQF